jgi:Tol biopolymer transport system component
MLDTESNDARQVTNDTDDQYSVAASPDGRQLAYSEYKRDLDIVNVTLKDGVTSRLIATDVSEWMPAWSLRSPKLVYSTNRNGIMEIWLRTGDGQDRPLVTAQNFSDGGTRFFMNPALSPNGETVLFSRKNDLGDTRSWVMPVATGIPQRLNESASDTEHVAGWSPDGTRVIELAVAGGSETLAIVKVGSREKPFILRGNVYSDLPAWSPSGEWITFYDKTGWNLISPDGKTVKPLGKIATSYLMFSRDGKLLYGIRSEGSKRILFSLDIATKAIHDIRDLGIEFAPMSDYSPGIRYTLTPDGESMTYAVATQKSDLWLLEGFRPPGLFARLFR